MICALDARNAIKNKFSLIRSGLKELNHCARMRAISPFRIDHEHLPLPTRYKVIDGGTGVKDICSQ